VSLKNDTALVCYNFDLHQPIVIIFGMNVAKKVKSPVVPYFFTSPNDLTSASALPGKARKHENRILFTQML